jgi:hypothetical protein
VRLAEGQYGAVRIGLMEWGHYLLREPGFDPYPLSCPLHKAILNIDEVRVEYGRPAFWRDAEQFFPYSNRTLNGGCIVGPTKYGIVMFCPICRGREAEKHRVN